MVERKSRNEEHNRGEIDRDQDFFSSSFSFFGSSPSFIAALKLRMPSPIPLPTAENLLVPKSRRAIAITNSQCQSENSPITPPFRHTPRTLLEASRNR